MNDDHLEPRLTRTAVLRLAGAGAAGLALGVPPARAAPTDAAAVETAARAFLASLSPAGRDRASFPFAGAERTRWHWTVPASVPAERPSARSDVGRPAEARARAAALEQLARRLPQVARHHGAAGRAAAHEHGVQRSVRPRPLLRLGVRHARGPSVGMAVRGAPSLEALHRRRRAPSSPSPSSSAPGRPARRARTARSPAATGRCRARRTPPGRSCSRSTAGCGGRWCSRRSRSPTTSPRTPSG